MADLGRKDLTSQVEEKVTPDSQKSTLDQAKETVTGTADRAAGALQPQDQKSTGQKIGDSVRGTSDDASSQSKGVLEQAQDTVSSGLNSASDALGLNKK